MSQHILHTFSISVSILTKCVILSLVRSFNKRTKCMTNLSSAAPTRAPSASSVSLPQHRQVHQVHHQSLFRSTNTVTKCIRLTSFPSRADIAALTGDLKLRIEYNFVSYWNLRYEGKHLNMKWRCIRAAQIQPDRVNWIQSVQMWR